jgi:SAM-dependent methyltransferase
MAVQRKSEGRDAQAAESLQIAGLNRRENALILDLASPSRGESILMVGLDTGERSLFFHDLGCDVTSVIPSPHFLGMAQQKLGSKAALYLGKAEDLVFSDNEFDIVFLILSLEYTPDPEKAISEAIRVCRGRVFLGVMNKLSLVVLKPAKNEIGEGGLYPAPRYFYAGELLGMVRRQLPAAQIRWGSVIFLPDWGGKFTIALDNAIPVGKNPFGAFLGICFNVTFNLRAVQDIIGSPFQLNMEGGQTAPGIVREGRYGYKRSPSSRKLKTRFSPRII